MSAVILAVIVIMWAVVLVPMWLRRHDTVTENRSVDRFSTAMRVLSRRQPGGSPDRRYVLMPRREARTSVHVSGASASQRRTSTRPTPAAPPARPKSRPSLAVRRRRVLLGLAGFTFLTLVLTVAGVLGWPFQLVVDLILVAFVVHLRTQAKRTAAVSRQRRRAAVAPEVTRPARPAVPAARPAAARPAASRPPMTSPQLADDDVETIVMEPIPDDLAGTGTDDADGSRWDPVPVPRPTYTMKPKAPQRWTYAPPAADRAPEPMVEPTGEMTDLDEILEHRWAVND